MAGCDKYSENWRYGRLSTTSRYNGGSSSSTQKSTASSGTVSILNAIALKIHLLAFGYSKQDSCLRMFHTLCCFLN